MVINYQIYDAYSQLASAKLAICRKKTFLGVSKLSFLRGLRLILCCIFRMDASDRSEKSVPFGIYCRMSLLAFSIAPFCHDEYESAKNTRLGFLVPFGANAFEINRWAQNSEPLSVVIVRMVCL